MRLSLEQVDSSRNAYLMRPPQRELKYYWEKKMSTIVACATTEKIGETAGQVWQALDTQGPQKITQLVKEMNAPRDLVMQALGWLAREEKIAIEEQSRSRFVSLAR